MDGIRIAHTEKRGCAFVPLCVCTYDRDGKEADRHRVLGKTTQRKLGRQEELPNLSVQGSSIEEENQD